MDALRAARSEGRPASLGARLGSAIGYNFPFSRSKKIDMEAERLNAIEASLADLRRRAGELRGYL